jgi:hypothetical protein
MPATISCPILQATTRLCTSSRRPTTPLQPHRPCPPTAPILRHSRSRPRRQQLPPLQSPTTAAAMARIRCRSRRLCSLRPLQLRPMLASLRPTLLAIQVSIPLLLLLSARPRPRPLQLQPSILRPPHSLQRPTQPPAIPCWPTCTASIPRCSSRARTAAATPACSSSIHCNNSSSSSSLPVATISLQPSPAALPCIQCSSPVSACRSVGESCRGLSTPESETPLLSSLPCPAVHVAQQPIDEPAAVREERLAVYQAAQSMCCPAASVNVLPCSSFSVSHAVLHTVGSVEGQRGPLWLQRGRGGRSRLHRSVSELRLLLPPRRLVLSSALKPQRAAGVVHLLQRVVQRELPPHSLLLPRLSISCSRPRCRCCCCCWLRCCCPPLVPHAVVQEA